MSRTLLFTFSALLASGCTVFGADAAEEPAFRLVAEDRQIQIREYGQLLVAQTEVQGDYDDIGGVAFRRLAGFIFGDNQSGEKVAMTAPVLQEPAPRGSKGEKIAMTAPVFQEQEGDRWIMTFVMPAEYTLETLPQPTDPLVEITTVPPRRVATLRFSGLMSERKLDRYSEELSDWLTANGYVATSAPRSAGYDPPWTLPPLRRNEIHIDIQ